MSVELMWPYQRACNYWSTKLLCDLHEFTYSFVPPWLEGSMAYWLAIVHGCKPQTCWWCATGNHPFLRIFCSYCGGTSYQSWQPKTRQLALQGKNTVTTIEMFDIVWLILIDRYIHSFIYSFIHSVIHSLSHSFICSFIHCKLHLTLARVLVASGTFRSKFSGQVLGHKWGPGEVCWLIITIDYS